MQKFLVFSNAGNWDSDAVGFMGVVECSNDNDLQTKVFEVANIKRQDIPLHVGTGVGVIDRMRLSAYVNPSFTHYFHDGVEDDFFIGLIKL